MIAISGAMSTTAGDTAEIHAGLMPLRLIVSKVQHCAALRMSTLPLVHPISKVVTNARRRRIKQHTTRIHNLIWTFDLDPGRMKKVEAVRYDVEWKAGMERRIAGRNQGFLQWIGSGRGDRRGGGVTKGGQTKMEDQKDEGGECGAARGV